MGSCHWLSPNWQDANGIFDANLTSQSSAMGNPGLQIRVTSLMSFMFRGGVNCLMLEFWWVDSTLMEISGVVVVIQYLRKRATRKTLFQSCNRGSVQ